MVSSSLFAIVFLGILSGYPTNSVNPFNIFDGPQEDRGFLPVTGSCPSDKDKPWSFDKSLPNGPAHWADSYPNCADNGMQSPITIKVDKLSSHPEDPGLNVSNYDTPMNKITVKNNGYTVEVIPKDDVKRSVTFGGKTYPLKLFIIRYGERTEYYGFEFTSPGSDHRYYHKQFTAEIQLIHGSKDDMVIVSVLAGGVPFPDKFYNKILTPETLENIHYKGDSYDLSLDDTLKLSDIVHSGISIYSYEG